FVEQRRTSASFAMLAAVATLTVRDGLVADTRLALANAADRPLRARTAEQAMIGEAPTMGLFATAGDLAVRDADPRPEPHCGVAYRRHAIAVLTLRALEEALADVGGAP